MAEDMSGLSYRRDGDGPMELSPSVVYIEACENYQKQSYRNRCRFYAADGVQPLSFPIIHEEGTYKHPVKDIKVDYSTPWLLQHKRAIVSAYRTSAYFEYYQDELFAILDSSPQDGGPLRGCFEPVVQRFHVISRHCVTSEVYFGNTNKYHKHL